MSTPGTNEAVIEVNIDSFIRPRNGGVQLMRAGFLAVLAVILLIAVLFRSAGLDWDREFGLNNQEQAIVARAAALSWPGSSYFDTESSPLNPLNAGPTFPHGFFPLVLGKALDPVLLGSLERSYRTLAILFDLGTVLLIAHIGRRLFGQFAGLLAALLYAICILPIQLAHFGSFTLVATFFSVATFAVCLHAVGERTYLWLGLASVCVGLALASSLDTLPAAFFLLIPLSDCAIRRRESGWRAWGRTNWPLILATAGSALLAALVFRIAQPYAFTGPGFFGLRLDARWLADIRLARNLRSGSVDSLLSLQWAGDASYVTLLRNLLLWGMGPALGMTALIGLVLAIVRIATEPRISPVWLLALAGWPLVSLALVGRQLEQSMYRVAPAVPFLVLLAAAALVQIPRTIRQRTLPPWLRLAPVALVVIVTAVGALSFTSAFTSQPTRLAASAWIMQQTAQGSSIAVEQWPEDPGYLAFTPEVGATHTMLTMPTIDIDSADNLNALVSTLDGSEYILIVGDQGQVSVDHMPERYPVTQALYRALYDGSLGFEQVAEFDAPTGPLGWFADATAVELGYTRFDRPAVTIFHKIPSFTPEAVHDLLAPYLVYDVLNVPAQVGGYNLLMLTESERLAQRAGGTWSDIFSPGSLANRYPLIVWYLALQLAALVAIPLATRLLRWLPDHGYAASKSLGLLLVSVVAWLLGSYHLVSFGRGSVAIGLLVVACIGIALWRGRLDEMARALRPSWRWIAVTEALFLAGFLFFAFVRALNPDLWHSSASGEKTFDLAFFTAVIKSSHFPPYDPWFAGGYMNYYYFGWVVFGSIAHLTGIVPSVAYNLAVATTFALVAVNAWIVCATVITFLPRPWKPRSTWTPIAAGVIGAIFYAVIGNLDLARRIAANNWDPNMPAPAGLRGAATIARQIGQGTWDGLFRISGIPLDGYFSPTLLIPGAINEFPYFTFLHADLHPHLMAMPFTLLALIVGLAFAASPAWPRDAAAHPTERRPPLGLGMPVRAWLRSLPRRHVLDRCGLIALAAIASGALYPLNSWDYPTYLVALLGFIVLIDLLGSLHDPESSPPLWTFSYRALRRVVVSWGGMVLLGALIFLPFSRSFWPLTTRIIRVDDRTETPIYLLIFGFFWFVISLALLIDLKPRMSARRLMTATLPWPRHDAEAAKRRHVSVDPMFWGFATLLALLFMLSLARGSVLVLLGMLLALIVAAATMRVRSPGFLVLLGLALCGWGVSAIVEVVSLGALGRGPTIFKTFLQVWQFLALAAAVSAYLVVVALRKRVSLSLAIPGAVVGCVLLVATLLYPYYATRARTTNIVFDTPFTLDGEAFTDLADIYMNLPGQPDGRQVRVAADMQAIEWMRANIEGSPVVLEAITEMYKWGWRVSTYTGLPTILGWVTTHEELERPGFGPIFEQRQRDVTTMYSDPAFANVQPLLDKYHVEYIYIGELERMYYPAEGLQKFADAATDGLLEVVYDEENVTIYKYDPAPPPA